MKNRSNTTRVVIVIAWGVLALVGCGGNSESGQPPTPSPFIGAKGLGLEAADEAALLAALQAEARDQVTRMTQCITMPMAAPETEAIVMEGPSEVATTGTNLQETGVDEADILKVQGETAYVLRIDGLHVVRVWPAAEFGELAHLTLTGTPEGAFVTESHLVAITHASWADEGSGGSDPVAADGVQVSVIDITTPSAPRLLRQVQVRGHYVSSRRIDNRVVLVMSNTRRALRSHAQFHNWTASCESNMDVIRQQTETEIAQRRLADWLPPLLGTTSSPPRTMHALGPVYVSGVRGPAVLSLVQLAIDADDAQDSAVTVLGHASTVYASATAVYAAQSVAIPREDGSIERQSAIHIFALERDAPRYRGTGAVPGTLLNQFAMSEHRDVLRVATTSGATSGVYTVDLTHADLPIIGAVDGLAQGERIYAVRFVGETGYIVTFKKIDPLFVIDLANPRALTVTGELKVPGFSTYLHPLAGGRLIGLGNEADDQGSFAWFEGLKLSLFDVSHPANPTELSHTIIGTRGSYSPALYDHHAFTYDPTRQLLALPVTVYDGEVNGSECGRFAYDGVHLYRVGDTEFHLEGVIRQASVSGTSCWGAPAGTNDTRTAILGDVHASGVLTLAAHGLQLHALDSLDAVGTLLWD